MADTAPAYDWAGKDRNGRVRFGDSTWEDLAGIVRRRFDDGWESLTVMRAGSPDRVAAIEVQGEHRVWWATVPARADG